MIRGLLCFMLMMGALFGQDFRLVMPTENRALLTGKLEDFYMNTSNGRWQGGMYGYSRTVIETNDGLIGTKFHEGIDIKPLNRDGAGRPTDRVGPVAPGVVVYANDFATRSSYGKYVVVEHPSPMGKLYSLYAHLGKVSCQAGQTVRPGDALGILGYTGHGINLKRAHLHLELNVLLSERFDSWHYHHLHAVNVHGIANGINLIGLDVPELLKRSSLSPKNLLGDYLRTVKPRFTVTVPRNNEAGEMEIVRRYPWLRGYRALQESASWEVDVSEGGIPLAVRMSERVVSEPQVTRIQTTKTQHLYYTRRFVSGSGQKAVLTSSGKRFVSLLTGSFPEIPREKMVPAKKEVKK